MKGSPVRVRASALPICGDFALAASLLVRSGVRQGYQLVTGLAGNRSAGRCSAPSSSSITCAYVESAIVGECPACRATSTTEAPSAISSAERDSPATERDSPAT
jgi:hypothetical protein